MHYPLTARQEAELLRLLIEEDAELCRDSYLHFIKSAWSSLEPGTEFKSNWHIDAISDHLQAVAEGKIRRLIINIPPRHMKTIATSVCFQPWVWTKRPNFKILSASYAKEISIRDSVSARRLIDSPWYQERFKGAFKMTSDQNVKSRYENDQHGFRIATSIDSAMTGDGGDCIVIDDPLNARESQQIAALDAVQEWWDQTVGSRLNDPKTGAYIIIMQRLHDRDLCGHILAKETGWDHLMLPCRFEKSPLNPLRSSLGFKDPRTKEGELIWSERFGEAEVKELERKLGAYGAAGQLQQRPTPAGGGLIQTDKFMLWPSKGKLPKFQYIIQSYDTAYTDKTQNDPTACTVWGIFEVPKKKKMGMMLLDCWTEHLDYPDLRKRMADDFFEASYGGDERKADEVLVEAKGSGQSIISDLCRMNRGEDRVNVRIYNPGKADKVSRVHLMLPQLDEGLIFLPESKASPGHPTSWAISLVNECNRFPRGIHDDLVDSMTQAMIRAKDMRMVSVDDDWIEDSVTWWKKSGGSRINPYAA